MDAPRRDNSEALDQWRGLALLFVLVSHGFFFTGSVQGLGRIGVNLFFFISGILVFRSLVSTQRSGTDRAFSFWKRRLLRLYPALVGYVIAAGALVYFLQGRPGLPLHSSFADFLRSVPIALFYAVDFTETPMSLGHLWSVSVEMQFYLLAPLIYLLGGESTPRRLASWISLLVVLMTLGLLEPLRGYREKYHFEVAAWPMMLGFLAEYLKPHVRGLPGRLIQAGIGAGGALLALATVLSILDMKKGLVIALGATVFVPCFLCYVSQRTAPGPVGTGATWLGQRTYSIYLWQQPLTLCGFLPNVLHPVGAVVAIGVGAIWYHYLEVPFLSSRRRRVTEDAVS